MSFAKLLIHHITRGSAYLQDQFNFKILDKVNEIAGSSPNQNPPYRKITAATDTIRTTDFFLGVTYTATGTVTLTLPLAATAGVIWYVIKDEGGKAASNKITVNASGSDTFEDSGDTDIILNKNNIGIMIYSDGIDKWFVFGGA